MVILALPNIGRQENIAEEGTKRYLRFLQKRGIKEFYINGSTAEAFILSVEQRKKNLEIIQRFSQFAINSERGCKPRLPLRISGKNRRKGYLSL